MLSRSMFITLAIAAAVLYGIVLASSFAANDAERARQTEERRYAERPIGLPSSSGEVTYASRASWRYMVASSYGPGLWGNYTGCPAPWRVKLQTWSVFVAARQETYPCGALLRVCSRGRCVDARVRDRGPYVRGRDLDLTQRLVQKLGYRDAYAWGVRTARVRCIRRCR